MEEGIRIKLIEKKLCKLSKYLEKKYMNIEILSMAGGFSTVLKGKNRKMERIEAIKAINCCEVISQGLSLSKIEQEYKILAKLDHPNIVKVFNIINKSTEDEEYLFIVMEYCDSNLLSILSAPTPLGIQGYRQLLEEIIGGVAYMHGQGVIHRDLKPENIFIKGGKVKIGDFNISKIQGLGSLTLPHDVMLTLAYSPPERLSGMMGGDERKIDSWGIGCLWYYMVMGQRPFKGSDQKELGQNILGIKYASTHGLEEMDRKIIEATLVEEGKRMTVIELKESLSQGNYATTPVISKENIKTPEKEDIMEEECPQIPENIQEETKKMLPLKSQIIEEKKEVQMVEEAKEILKDGEEKDISKLQATIIAEPLNISCKLHEHPLINKYHESEWKCNGMYLFGKCLAREEIFYPGSHSMNCEKCAFNLCQKCFLTSLNSKMSNLHEHMLSYIIPEYKNGKWRCNGVKLFGKCISGNKGGIWGEETYAWRCGKCNFDLCDKCYQTSMESKLSKLHGHMLNKISTKEIFGLRCECDGRKYFGKCLSNFKDNRFSNEAISWRCARCNFDLCEKCFQEPLESKMSNLHDHILVNVIPPHNGWKCSGIKLYGSCLLGDGYFPRGTLAWRCPKCDFDLCEKCFQKSLTSVLLRVHKHFLTYINSNSPFKCDGKRLFGKCLSGGGVFQKGTASWSCRECYLDICKKCFEAQYTPTS